MATDFAYPDDVTSAEKELGFRRMEVEALGRLLEPLNVAAITLSPNDLLIKTLDVNNRVIYAHKRWAKAWLPTARTPTNPRWEPITAMQLDAVQGYVASNPPTILSIIHGIHASETSFQCRLLE